MPRVSVVRVSAEEVIFAPHTGRKWLTRDLANYYGDAPLEVGQVGELEEDSANWMFEIDPGWRIELKSLTAVGSPESMTFLVSGTKTKIDLTGHGVQPAMKGKAASRLKFWRLVRCGGEATGPVQASLHGHFDHPDLMSWVAEIEEQVAAEKERKQNETLLHRKRDFEKQAQDHFINPYTFVPFPAQPPQRSKPHDHHTLATEKDEARFSGRITARLVARSPLLVRNVGSAAPVVDDVATAPRTSTGGLFIPGSSLHGAIRSLHETLTGSCLRVFDPDFVPVYRDIATGELRPHWDLGVVDEVDHAGRPVKLIRCTETRWVPLTTLARAMPGGSAVTTGQRFRLTESAFATQQDTQAEEDEETPPATLDPKGEWAVLVTDDRARRPTQPYHCAVGRLPAAPRPVALTDRAWQKYLRAVEGAKQTMKGNKPSLEAEVAQLARPGTTVGDVLGELLKQRPGRWLRPRPWLHKGQVVWLAPGKGGFVDGIALSYLWRTAGQDSAGKRLPDERFHPCHDPDELCPSCRVFGSADVRDVGGRGVDRRLAEQRSYRGHVRVLDAVLKSGGPLGAPVVLPATGSPRPGSGQFYLDDPQADKAPLVYQKPRNRWGTPDARQPRRLRGRKFYWHTDPQIDERRKRWRRHDHAPEGERVELVAAGSAYQLDVAFDGLTKAEIGGLVAALQPDRLFATQHYPLPYPVTADPEYAIHVGGGKPLGLGSCQARDLRIVADGVESRYLGAQRPVLDPADLIAAFVADHADLSPTWQNVAAALHTGHVDSRIVSYPTAINWADNEGICGGEKQHQAFKWFQQTIGEGLKDGTGGRPFVPLPPVSDIAPVLPVHCKERT
ncbi:MAG: hypothetical protein ACRDTG_29720 [Pseudonocardiaceae bacterium]